MLSVPEKIDIYIDLAIGWLVGNSSSRCEVIGDVNATNWRLRKSARVSANLECMRTYNKV